MSSSSESGISTPENIKLNAETVLNNLLPKKSREKYLKTYEHFITWKNEQEAKSFSETVFLAYFQHLAKTKQPSTLWSVYSMLKSTVNTKKNMHIEKYSKLTAYLKQMSLGHKSKKSKVLTRQNVETFLNEAPDDDFLVIKVALIFGVHGACRGTELVNISVKDVERHSDQLLLVNLKDTKSEIDRSFTIRGQYKNIVDKYQKLRPSDTETSRFFIRFQNGKCFKQNIGKNKISKMPEDIAKYLKLPDSHLYTGHCFRRTSSTLLGESGVDLTNLMRYGCWNYSGVAEGYIEGSNENKVTQGLEKKVVGELLVMYKNLPCLWDVTDQFYSNKVVRNRAYDKLVEKYKEIDKECDHRMLKKKIDNLRITYKQERQKVLKSTFHDGERYKPLLWYYPLFSFLEQLEHSSDEDSRGNESPESTQEVPDEMASTESIQQNERLVKIELTNENSTDMVELDLVPETVRANKSVPDYEEDIGMTAASEIEIKYRPEKRPKTSAVFIPETDCDYNDESETPKTKATKRRKKNKSKSDSTSIEVEDDDDEDDLFLHQVQSSTSSGFPENDLFAKIMTSQLGELRPKQRFIAQKLMSEVIFFGRMDKLRTDTKLQLVGD